MPNQFCRYLSNGYSFSIAKNSTVTAKPCCLYKNPVQLNEQLVDTRRSLSESIVGWTDACGHCKILEDAGQQSLRQTGPDWIDDFENSQDPVTLDIRLDTECNAACVICSKHSSSLWAKEHLKLQGKKIKIINDSHLVDDIIDKIVNSVSLEKLKYVKFFGGEPLFTDTHLKFIKHIPHPEQVTLHYTTNGSIYPNDNVLFAWKKFKVVIFATSLDGIEEQFDYVRWPLPWNKVSKNLIRLKENKDISNLMFRVEFTANFLNTYYFDRLENWIKNNLDTNLGGDKTEINIHPCWDVWDLNKMPLGVKNLILTKYPSTHAIHKIISNLPQSLPLSNWQDFVNTWDSRRNNSWQTAFPELVDLI
jgi:sulfatase maturation enzyme AslB (radical SAM superfamily)